MGGAALAVPSLVYFLGFSTVEAIATTFPFTAIVQVGGFRTTQQARYFSTTGFGGSLLVGGVPGAVAGVALLSGTVRRVWGLAGGVGKT